jgi:hypothetical protein
MEHEEDVNRKSGPQGSLRRGSGEVRMVQFEITRNCSVEFPDDQLFDEAEVVWVQWPPVAQSDYAEVKCGELGVLIINPCSTHYPNGAMVCEHMGRLIE